MKQSDSMERRRGAGQQPKRSYSAWEWTRGYLALALTLPIYLALWLFAKLCPRLPEWATKLLLAKHNYWTTNHARDVRIPWTGDVYMHRWWRVPRNWAMNVYYHIVAKSDEDAALHDHPWWNFSIVLEGGYYEHVIEEGGINRKTWYGPGSVRFRPRGSFAHRLELDRIGTHEKAVKTIFVTGPVLRRWGFHHTTGFVDAYDWDQFCEDNDIQSNKMKGYAAQVSKERRPGWKT
ncbi:MAG: hypothetical protein CMF19_07820 [Idiomarinaceae bacterium]|nr:hypothetical protein [Idiomarinaceae bacterium]